MVQDRRQFQRLIPDSPLPVCWGDEWSGRLCDLSEAGLAVDGLPLASSNQVVSLAFDLPGENQQIQARAEIAWTSESAHRNGLRFLDLAEASRQQLKEWISARVRTTALTPAGAGDVPPVRVTAMIDALPSLPDDWGDGELARLRNSLVPIDQTTGFNLQKLQLMADEALSRLSKLRRPIGLVLLVVVLVPIPVFLGHLLADWGNKPLAMEISATSTAAASSSDVNRTTVLPPPVIASTPTLAAARPFDLPGFVLQVGAMSHEDNADLLRESLEQKNFPAFVFKRETGRFYRVAVGPYNDADAAVRVKDQLKQEGFDAIIKLWSPN
jgi:hypothetical protein